MIYNGARWKHGVEEYAIDTGEIPLFAFQAVERPFLGSPTALIYTHECIISHICASNNDDTKVRALVNWSSYFPTRESVALTTKGVDRRRNHVAVFPCVSHEPWVWG